MEKMTKKVAFTELINMVEASNREDKDELITILQKQVASLDARSKRAAEKAIEKAAKADEMRKAIQGILSETPKTADQLVGELAEIGFEEVTRAKVTSRMKALIDNGVAQKGQIKIEDRKVMAYALPGAFDSDAE